MQERVRTTSCSTTYHHYRFYVVVGRGEEKDRLSSIAVSKRRSVGWSVGFDIKRGITNCGRMNEAGGHEENIRRLTHLSI